MSYYGEVPAVKARAGRIGNLWTDTSEVNEAAIETFLEDGSGEVDVRLAAHGIPVPVTDPTALAALRPLVADYALVRALDASFAGAPPAAEVSTLRDGAQTRWDAFLTALEAGGTALITLLETGASVPLASSFWGSEPAYGQNPSPFAEDTNYRLLPYIARGDKM